MVSHELVCKCMPCKGIMASGTYHEELLVVSAIVRGRGEQSSWAGSGMNMGLIEGAVPELE